MTFAGGPRAAFAPDTGTTTWPKFSRITAREVVWTTGVGMASERGEDSLNTSVFRASMLATFSEWSMEPKRPVCLHSPGRTPRLPQLAENPG